MNSEDGKKIDSSGCGSNLNTTNNNVDQSKGAIPKNRTKMSGIPSTSTSSSKSTEKNGILKLNNNLEANVIKNSKDMKLDCSWCISNSLDRNKSKMERLNIPVDFRLSPEPDFDIDSESVSSDDNELLSVSDDGCIYTYKADVADLPSSFYEIPNIEELEVKNDREEHNSSPEMDFLEMDFDPGDSDGNTGSLATPSANSSKKYNSENKEKSEIKEGDGKSNNCSIKINTNDLSSDFDKNNAKPSNSSDFQLNQLTTIVKQACNNNTKRSNCQSTNNFVSNSLKKEFMPWYCKMGDRTRSAAELRTVKRHHSSKGELLSPESPKMTDFNTINNNSDDNNIKYENSNNFNSDLNLSPDKGLFKSDKDGLNCLNSGNKLFDIYNKMTDVNNSIISAFDSFSSSVSDMSSRISDVSQSIDSDISNKESFSDSFAKITDCLNKISNKMADIVNIERKLDVSGKKCMIWTEREAYLKQITQIAPSSCGATAVLNVLNALRLPLTNLTIENVQECVGTRFRDNNGPLMDYLISRSKAGCTHRELISGLYKVSNGRVYSRFFHMYPERFVNLQRWLGYWIQQGAVPIATLNLQKSRGEIPDSWHHQMIFGVDADGIYLTNPLEYVEASQLWPQLSSESVLLVRRQDVLSRFNYKTDLSNLIRLEDVRWRDVNVVGQLAKLVRESRREGRPGSTITSHLKIPADYKAGITLAMDINSPALPLLRQCPELPLLRHHNAFPPFNNVSTK